MGLDTEAVRLVGAYGAWIVGGAVGIESMGIPRPGETLLITAAVYAGKTGRLSIVAVVAAAAIGAIVGDNIGFWIGRRLGYPWVVRHQKALRLTPRRLKLGQYLFLRHGGKVVFFGRFIAVLRGLAAFLAGVNCMGWRRFLLFNAGGAVVWASVYGIGPYAFGGAATQLLGDVGIVLLVVAAALMGVALFFARKYEYERRLENKAERALPGPRSRRVPPTRLTPRRRNAIAIISWMTDPLPVACSLSPEALAARRQDLLRDLVARAELREVRPSGWHLRFHAEHDILMTIARTIEAERQCCRFLRFEIAIEPDGGPIALDLSGPPGTTEFLSALFEP